MQKDTIKCLIYCKMQSIHTITDLVKYMILFGGSVDIEIQNSEYAMSGHYSDVKIEEEGGVLSFCNDLKDEDSECKIYIKKIGDIELLEDHAEGNSKFYFLYATTDEGVSFFVSLHIEECLFNLRKYAEFERLLQPDKAVIFNYERGFEDERGFSDRAQYEGVLFYMMAYHTQGIYDVLRYALLLQNGDITKFEDGLRLDFNNVTILEDKQRCVEFLNTSTMESVLLHIDDEETLSTKLQFEGATEVRDIHIFLYKGDEKVALMHLSARQLSSYYDRTCFDKTYQRQECVKSNDTSEP